VPPLWLENDGFIHGEQLTPGAPWRIRLTGEIRALLVDDTPDGWLATLEATHAYGLSRQTLCNASSAAKSALSYLRTGRKKGLRIATPSPARRAVLTDKIQQQEQCNHASNTAVNLASRSLIKNFSPSA